VKISYGQLVRVIAESDDRPNLVGKELYVDEIDPPESRLRFFVDSDPNPNDVNVSNDNEDYGYVSDVEPVMPERFVDRDRYFVDGIRKFALIDEPATVEAGEPDLQAKLGAEAEAAVHDPVDHPSHYTSTAGVECIDVTEQFNFNRGNAIKYIWRAGGKGDEIEDLRKAAWYINREIERISR